MKRNSCAVIVMGTLLAAAPLSGKSKKVSGEILDRQGFDHVHSYCVQVQDLASRYAGMVQNFFKDQNKPGSLVNQLPWKLVSDCSQADAVMSFKFSESQEPSYATAGGTAQAGASMGTVNTTWFQVTAVVSSRLGLKPIYQVQGARAPQRGERAIEKTFRELAKDLRAK